MVQLSMTSTDT